MIPKIWRLSEDTGDNNLGLACTEQGLLLGRTALIERRDERFVVREQSELECLFSLAYGREATAQRLMPGLATVASALNADDQALARIAAVHLRIPDLPDQAARDVMEAADILIKYARDEGGSDWNPALHPRAGTPPNPGWFAPTGGADDASSSIRTAQNENSAQRLDFLPNSLRPGDPFPTADAAAIGALLASYRAAQTANLEYAGRIYQSADGNFSFTQARTLSQLDPSIPNRNCCLGHSSPGDAPQGTVAVGSYHTHPVVPGFNEAEFSGEDVEFLTDTDKLPGYLAGTNERGDLEILRFTPGETIHDGITQVLGTISKGLFVPDPAYDPTLKPYKPPPGGDSYEPDWGNSKWR